MKRMENTYFMDINESIATIKGFSISGSWCEKFDVESALSRYPHNVELWVFITVRDGFIKPGPETSYRILQYQDQYPFDICTSQDVDIHSLVQFDVSCIRIRWEI